jgi:NitT/TauT family transport system ATP-binding protein
MKKDITIHGLKKAYLKNKEHIHVLDDITLNIKEDQFVSVVGLTGCGKTTLLKIIGGLLEPSSGEVRIAGASPRLALKRHKLGFVFQESSLLPWRSAYENVRLNREIFEPPDNAGKNIISDIMDSVGLANFKEFYPSELSGGMRVCVSIARTFSSMPKILLMDEPFSHLDEVTRQKMNELLLALWAKNKATTVLVTHNISDAVFLSDKVVVLTKRPAKIKKIIEIDFARPRARDLRFDAKFLVKVRELYDLLLE